MFNTYTEILPGLIFTLKKKADIIYYMSFTIYTFVFKPWKYETLWLLDKMTWFSIVRERR